MQNFVNTGFDLEVVPSKDDIVVANIRERVAQKKITPPDVTKDVLAEALDITEPKIIRELSKGDLQTMWIEKFEPIEREKMFNDAWHKACFESVTGEIVSASLNAFGMGICGAYFRSNDIMPMESIDGKYHPRGDEVQILNSVIDMFDKLQDWASANGGKIMRLIGLNIFHFDLKYLLQRCMITGARMPKFNMMFSEFDTLRQLDLGKMWNCGETPRASAGNLISLEKLCFALGVDNPKIDDEGEIHGSDVCDIYYGGGNHGALRIAKYNLRDVESYEHCFNKMKGIFGQN